MSDDLTPLETLEQAIQQFANSMDEGPVLLRGAVVVFEAMTIDEDGDSAYGVDYATTANTSVSEGVGLLRLALQQVLDDVGGFRHREDLDEP